MRANKQPRRQRPSEGRYDLPAEIREFLVDTLESHDVCCVGGGGVVERECRFGRVSVMLKS
jgi:hypothetical protein